MTYEEDVLYWAKRYLSVGIALVVLPYGAKSPAKTKASVGWQSRRPTADDIAEALTTSAINLGGQLGEASGQLHRLDPDWEELRIILAADPIPTGLVMTRDGSTHPTGYFYRLTGDPVGPKKYVDPTDKNATIADLLGSGKQSVLPPSVHPDGGQYRWSTFGAPAVLDPETYEREIVFRVAAALVARHWPDGARHDCTMALVGGLLLAGWSESKVEAFLTLILLAAGDDEVHDRVKLVYDTADRIAAGKDVVGFPRLTEYIDEQVVRRLVDWLGITEDKRAKKLALAGDLRLTDLGNAERLVRLFGDRIRYVPRLHKWLFWNGTVWQNEDHASPLSFAIETARAIRVEAATADTRDKGQQLEAWAVESESVRRLSAMTTIVQSMPEIFASEDTLDTHDWLLNTPSGVLDLRTFQRFDPDPRRLITHITPAAYDPSAPAPRWRQFIVEIFDGAVELMQFVRRAAGLSLTGSLAEQVLFLCFGGGANGKSKFLHGLRTALGTYAGVTAFDTFDADARRGSINNDLAALRGTRLVTAIETDQERRLAEAKVKMVTGGDPVSCRFLWGEFFSYTPTYKIWLAVNHKPIIRGTDRGIWRRIMFVPFLRTFDGINEDKNLDAVFTEERAGILAWMVEGLRDYLDRGLDPPASVLDATATYKSEMDIVADFIEQNLVVKAGSTTTGRELYSRYTYWAKDFGEKQLSHRALSLALEPRGFTRRKSNGQILWNDLELRPESFGALSQNGVHA